MHPGDYEKILFFLRVMILFMVAVLSCRLGVLAARFIGGS